MPERLWNLFGRKAKAASDHAKYDPVYGFPKQTIEEWLARSPRLREKYELEEWLARNPPLRAVYQASWQQRNAPRKAGTGEPLPDLRV
jgi:hypothetical protein